jgi:hypothetical protein
MQNAGRGNFISHLFVNYDYTLHFISFHLTELGLHFTSFHFIGSWNEY